jgi:hypothetical protein
VDPPLWHVTVTLAGEPADREQVRLGLEQLVRERPFLESARYGDDRAELRYWDEAEDVDDAAAMALRLWADHRDSAGLPPWTVVGLEVLDRGTVRERGARGLVAPALVLGDVRPL